MTIRQKQHLEIDTVDEKTPLLLSDSSHRRSPNYDRQKQTTPTQSLVPPSGDLGVRCWTSVFPAGFKSEFREMLAITPSLVLSMVCQIMMQPVAVIFGGHLGKLELDAIGLANSLINVLGTSVVMGLATGCDTIFSQTYGSTNRANLGIQLQRGLVIVLLCLLPCYAIHLNAESILLLVGQDPEVSRLVGRYMLVFTPGLFSLYLFTILRRYVQCQNIVYPHLVIGLLGLGSHALLQYLFLYVLDYGLDGSALAQALAYILMVILTFGHLIVSGVYKATWSGWSLEMLEDWGTFASLCIYGMLMMCLEWWAFEITIFLSGLLGTTELAAQTVVLDLDNLFYGVATGVAVATSIRVGQCLGAGEPVKAKTAARVGMCIIVTCSVVVCVIVGTLRYEISKLFTSDPDVINLVAATLWLLLIYFIFVFVMTIGRGIIQGCGYQQLGFYSVLVSYYLVAMPIGIPLMFLTSWRTIGIWIGMAVAVTALGMFYFIYITFLLNWERVVDQTQKRVGAIPEITSTDEPSIDSPENQTDTFELLNTQDSSSKDSDPGRTVALPVRLVVRRILSVGLSLGLLLLGVFTRLFVALPESHFIDSSDNTTTMATIVTT